MTYLAVIGVLVYLAAMWAATAGLGWLLSRLIGESPVVYAVSAAVVLVVMFPPMLYGAAIAGGGRTMTDVATAHTTEGATP